MSGEIRRELRLGVLDQSPIPDGLTAADALRNSIDLARSAEEFGYSRYWVAEHHGSPGLACNSPEVLIGPIAAATNRIRVGSGGVMLPHYSPLKVAESFSMLSGLFPGRIDLGIGRAAGTSPNVARALQRDRSHTPPDDFREQLEELLRFTGNRAVPGDPFSRLSLPLLRFASPEISLLGSSPQSALWAAELGLPYVFADFINSNGAEISRLYQERFRPSEYLSHPRVSVALWAICATTDEEAERLSLSARMMLALLVQGRQIAVPRVSQAEEYFQNEGVTQAGRQLDLLPSRRFLTGTPANIRASIRSVATEYGAGEVLLVNIMHDHAARRRSYELVAEAFGLVRLPHHGRMGHEQDAA